MFVVIYLVSRLSLTLEVNRAERLGSKLAKVGTGGICGAACTGSEAIFWIFFFAIVNPVLTTILVDFDIKLSCNL